MSDTLTNVHTGKMVLCTFNIQLNFWLPNHTIQHTNRLCSRNAKPVNERPDYQWITPRSVVDGRMVTLFTFNTQLNSGLSYRNALHTKQLCPRIAKPVNERMNEKKQSTSISPTFMCCHLLWSWSSCCLSIVSRPVPPGYRVSWCSIPPPTYVKINY
jgi:hypothetical protein